MAQYKVNEQRLRKILQRQPEGTWGASYVPAIWATPREAPSISEASIVYPAKLGGRAVHLLSHGEKRATLLALYNPNVWDLHEQRILSTTNSPHPLQGHPRCLGLRLPRLQGTLRVWERAGVLNRHLACRTLLPGDSTKVLVPFPYIGDLLLFLQDEQGSYVNNWSVKDTPLGFLASSTTQASQDAAPGAAGVQLRQQLEKQYYADANIRTSFVAKTAINEEVRLNLTSLFLEHGFNLNCNKRVEAAMIAHFRDGIVAGRRGRVVMEEISNKLGFMTIDLVKWFRSAVWKRYLRVDLFRPFIPDGRLIPERDDVLEVYSHWFTR